MVQYCFFVLQKQVKMLCRQNNRITGEKKEPVVILNDVSSHLITSVPVFCYVYLVIAIEQIRLFF